MRFSIYQFSCLALMVILGNVQVSAQEINQEQQSQNIVLTVSDERELTAIATCEAIGNKLGSVSIKECLDMEMQGSHLLTPNQNAILSKEYLPVEGKPPRSKVLLIGGIHGDEFSSVSVTFKWMGILNKHHSGLFHWIIAPAVNPDGLLSRPGQRQNSLGVDLNRNFPTPEWDEVALKYWVEKKSRNPRRYPGPAAGSEMETQWIVDLIDQFDPDVIIAVHAPYSLVDYDGGLTAPKKIGKLHLRRLGVYPGSMGNYGGVFLNKQVITLELPAAGSMPTGWEIRTMWTDLVRWLVKNAARKKAADAKALESTAF